MKCEAYRPLDFLSIEGNLVFSARFTGRGQAAVAVVVAAVAAAAVAAVQRQQLEKHRRSRGSGCVGSSSKGNRGRRRRQVQKRRNGSGEHAGMQAVPQVNNVCFHLKARKADPTCLFIFSNRTSNAVNYFPRREFSNSRDSG